MGNNAKEAFNLQWNIENFNFLPLKRGEMLKSPAFNLGVSDPLYLEFYPRGDILESDGESIVVCISRNNLNEYRVRDLCLTMTDNGLKTWNFNRVARQYDRLKWVFKPERDVMAETQKYKLLMTCTFCPIEEPSHIDAEDMEALSKDLENLYQNGQFSDLLITCKGHSFHVHECILSSRIPAFMNDLVTDETHHDHPNVKKTDLDIDTLKFLLHYIYTGRFLFTSKVPDGVFKVVELYQINDLKHSLYFLPTTLVADTYIKTDYIKLKWLIGPELMKISSTREIVSPAIPCNLPFKSDFRIICRFDDKGAVNTLKFGVRRIDLGNSSPIYIKLEISACNQFTVNANIAYQTFHSNEEKEFPLAITRWNDSVRLTCHFYMTDGESSSVIRTESHFSVHDQMFLKSRHLNTLCSDIGRLYNIFLPKRSDVSLHVGDVQFPVHKAVLSARSRVFSKMFETDMIEKKSGIVKISDIEVEKVNMMLCYLYNGKVSITNCALAMDLYAVADMYELTSLKERCFTFLRKSFGNSDCNPCDVYMFADAHSDEKLKKLVKKFLGDNCKTILKTDQFKSFIFSRPDLASEVLADISNNLQNIALS